MAFKVLDVDRDRADALLLSEESHTLDFKACEIAPAKLTRALSAFANAEGGELYIGVDEDKVRGIHTWRGFETIEAANGHVGALESTFPLGQFVDYDFLRREDDVGAGLVLKVSILKAPDVRRSSDGGVYVRRALKTSRLATVTRLSV